MTAEKLLSDWMSEISRKRTAESRSKAGAKAWQTRVANLESKLGKRANFSGEKQKQSR